LQSNTFACSCLLQELLEKCNPLGVFDAIASLAVAQNMRDLYRLVRRVLFCVAT